MSSYFYEILGIFRGSQWSHLSRKPRSRNENYFAFQIQQLLPKLSPYLVTTLKQSPFYFTIFFIPSVTKATRYSLTAVHNENLSDHMFSQFRALSSSENAHILACSRIQTDNFFQDPINFLSPKVGKNTPLLLYYPGLEF